MAARLWGFFLLVHVMLAAGIACALWHGGSLSPLAAIAIGLLVLPAPSALLVLASFARAAAGARSQGAERLQLMRSVVAECVDFDRAVLAMIVRFPRAHRMQARLEELSQPRPVLLIHGILCNGGVWRAWQVPLRAAGFGPIRALDLEPLLGSIDVHAKTVASALESLHHECRGAKVAIVAHSMGG